MRDRIDSGRIVGALMLGLILAVGLVRASVAAPPMDKLFDMSLSELLSVEITSAARKPQPVSQAAAAIFVITGDDIRRSGATSIPEALRMVPGLDVARIDGNKWAISSRGFNGRFANKLLVLIDGRSVYSPTFAGVYWDVQDTILEDIDRIEVIRGPGASLWGSNAVNGVINVITKSAAKTDGTLVSAGAGNIQRGFGNLRYGGSLGELGNYRVYAKYFDRANNYAGGRKPNDQWDQVRTGFRADLAPTLHDDVTLQGDFYDGRSGEAVNVNLPAPPYSRYVRDRQYVVGYNLLARWHHVLSETDAYTAQAYFDHTERDWQFLSERRNTVDLDLQYRTQRFDRHDLMLGFGYRFTEDFTAGSFNALADPADRGTQLFSAFLQDDVELIDDTLTFTLGSKLEHNDYTGFEGQPNARLLWTPNKKTTFWASVARAVRIPSRADTNISANSGDLASQFGLPLPIPVYGRVQGNPGFASESVVAYEAGYKQQINHMLSLDLALFYNRYTQLRGIRPESLVCQPGGGSPPDCFLSLPSPQFIDLITPFGNFAKMDTYGVELAVDWRPVDNWRFQGGYTLLKALNLRVRPGTESSSDPAVNPMQQFSLRGAWNPRVDVDVDLWLRYVDQIDSVLGVQRTKIPGYLQTDLRLAWRPLPKLELSVAGFNLLDNHHPEFVSEFGDVPLTEIRRSVHGQIRWEFE